MHETLDKHQAKLILTKSVYEYTGEWGAAQERLVERMLEYIYRKRKVRK